MLPAMQKLTEYLSDFSSPIEIAHAGEHLGLCSMDPPYPTAEQVLEHALTLSQVELWRRVEDLDSCPW